MSSDELNILRGAKRDGTLTLVCGAGVSKGCGLPDWRELLTSLLTDLASTFAPAPPSTRVMGLPNFGDSTNLIVGKILKQLHGEHFPDKLRGALYSSVGPCSKLILSIKELARPRRKETSLDSVITFNFDDVIEKCFGSEINHTSIHNEGQASPVNSLPVYHVHGFVPRVRDKSVKSNIVFSEDAYHDQFGDPFSWSNLIQLQKYSQSTCLFVGIGLADPNLRRLLDVSFRRNGKTIRHFIIMRRTVAMSDPVSDRLRELDAASLGLKVIWVDDFDEIPNFLSKI